MATPPQGPLPNLNDNNQASVYAAASICLPFALIATVLRFTARRLTRSGLWWDDWAVLVAMIADIGFFISTISLLVNGMGKHYQTDTPEQYTSFLKSYIPAACFYATGIANSKASLLAFYLRIFSTFRSLRIICGVIAFIVYGWMTSVILVSIFSCTPVAFWWDKTIPGGHCVDNTKFLLGNTIPNIITDFVLLGLPIPYIWGLQRSLFQKLAIYGIFLLGGFVCIITIIRLVIQINTDFASPDVTYNVADFLAWTNVEVSLAIVSACLPSLRPVITWLRHGTAMPTTTNKSSAMYPGNAQGGASAASRSRGWRPVAGNDTLASKYSFGGTSATRSHDPVNELANPNAIQLNHDITITHQDAPWAGDTTQHAGASAEPHLGRAL